MGTVAAPLKKPPSLYIYFASTYTEERCFKAGVGLLCLATTREVPLKFSWSRHSRSLWRAQQRKDAETSLSRASLAASLKERRRRAHIE